ncbi:hypothetical protein [Neorhizobium sp. P12A]|uniref:hypothetical protein n=1 Tax=Neorhizobium sp. P12A TaxID=2268027 RepID=UPI00165EA6DE|nr:hypothetical protein [Neorhizobium sp. P12A]
MEHEPRYVHSALGKAFLMVGTDEFVEREDDVVTAYHEAGHAVMAWALGVKVVEITTVPSVVYNSKGHVRWEFSEGQASAIAADDRRALKSLTLIATGGVAADGIHAGSLPTNPHAILKGTNSDFSNARRHMEKLGETQWTDLDAYVAIATHLMKQASVWAVVEFVSQILEERKYLTADELAEGRARTPLFPSESWDLLDAAIKDFRENPE